MTIPAWCINPRCDAVVDMTELPAHRVHYAVYGDVEKTARGHRLLIDVVYLVSPIPTFYFRTIEVDGGAKYGLF